MDVCFLPRNLGFRQRPILLNNNVDGENNMNGSLLVMETKYNIFWSYYKHANFSYPTVCQPVASLFFSRETQVYIDVIEVAPESSFEALYNGCLHLQTFFL